MGNSNAKDNLTAEEIAKSSKLSVEQVNTLLAAFKKNNSLKPINLKTFTTIIEQVGASHPHPAFTKQTASVVFKLFDTNHDDKVDAQELVSGVSILCEGSFDEKAKLTFQSFDVDGDGFLTRSELKKRLQTTLEVAKTLAESKGRSDAQAIGLPSFIGSLSVRPVVYLLNKDILDKLVNNFFTNDTNADGKLSLDEWLKGAATNENMKIFIDPYNSSHLWDKTFEEIQRTGEDNEQAVQNIVSNTGLKL